MFLANIENWKVKQLDHHQNFPSSYCLISLHYTSPLCCLPLRQRNDLSSVKLMETRWSRPATETQMDDRLTDRQTDSLTSVWIKYQTHIQIHHTHVDRKKHSLSHATYAAIMTVETLWAPLVEWKYPSDGRSVGERERDNTGKLSVTDDLKLHFLLYFLHPFHTFLLLQNAPQSHTNTCVHIKLSVDCCINRDLCPISLIMIRLSAAEESLYSGVRVAFCYIL